MTLKNPLILEKQNDGLIKFGKLGENCIRSGAYPANPGFMVFHGLALGFR
jgi:hypothetical protein